MMPIISEALIEVKKIQVPLSWYHFQKSSLQTASDRVALNLLGKSNKQELQNLI